MITRAQSKRIIEEVRENRRRLDSCEEHEFVSTDPKTVGAKHRCMRCGGTVDPINAHWYRRGLEHGK
jgi:hypothetical protein